MTGSQIKGEHRDKPLSVRRKTERRKAHCHGRMSVSSCCQQSRTCTTSNAKTFPSELPASGVNVECGMNTTLNLISSIEALHVLLCVSGTQAERRYKEPVKVELLIWLCWNQQTKRVASDKDPLLSSPSAPWRGCQGRRGQICLILEAYLGSLASYPEYICLDITGAASCSLNNHVWVLAALTGENLL